MIDEVAKAIDSVALFSRRNDFTSDKVEGLPIEICRYGTDDEEEIVVVARYGGDYSEGEALTKTVSEMRACAAVKAMAAFMLAGAGV